MFKGSIPTSDQPGTISGEILSVNQAVSDFVELLGGSLPNESFSFPFYPVIAAPTGTVKPNLGGILYAQDGNLMWIGSSGTISTVAGS